MTDVTEAQPQWVAAGRQKALAFLRLGPEASGDRYTLLEAAADAGEFELPAMVYHLAGYLENMACAVWGADAWQEWLDDEIAAAALEQTGG